MNPHTKQILVNRNIVLHGNDSGHHNTELKTGNWTKWTTPLKPGVQKNADAPEYFRIHVWFIIPVE